MPHSLCKWFVSQHTNTISISLSPYLYPFSSGGFVDGLSMFMWITYMIILNFIRLTHLPSKYYVVSSFPFTVRVFEIQLTWMYICVLYCIHLPSRDVRHSLQAIASLSPHILLRFVLADCVHCTRCCGFHQHVALEHYHLCLCNVDLHNDLGGGGNICGKEEESWDLEAAASWIQMVHFFDLAVRDQLHHMESLSGTS